jgi:hypothetical protein
LIAIVAIGLMAGRTGNGASPATLANPARRGAKKNPPSTPIAASEPASTAMSVTLIAYPQI